MNYAKYPVLFCTGGAGYMLLELLWRGWSHGSMFLAGGSCFLLLGSLNKMPAPLPVKAIAGAAVITSVELLAGLLVNRNYQVWDYRQLPLSFQGQICLPFSLLWTVVSLGGMGLYRFLERQLPDAAASSKAP